MIKLNDGLLGEAEAEALRRRANVSASGSLGGPAPPVTDFYQGEKGFVLQRNKKLRPVRRFRNSLWSI
jgi:hypothetical protein